MNEKNIINKINNIENRLSILENFKPKGTIYSTMDCPRCNARLTSKIVVNDGLPALQLYCPNNDCYKNGIINNCKPNPYFNTLSLEQLVAILNFNPLR